MSPDEQKFIQIALDAYRSSQTEAPKPKPRTPRKQPEPPPVQLETRKGKEPLRFTQKLVIFACAVYLATWIAAVVSWFWLNTVPDSLLGLGTGMFGLMDAIYGTKSGFENVAKINQDDTAG